MYTLKKIFLIAGTGCQKVKKESSESRIAYINTIKL